jgi:hypothetical protein
MTSLFLVSSAIYTSHGKCSTEERIEQTKKTIKSIETYAPDSTIVLLDAGEKSVDIDFGVELIDYTQKEIIKEPLNYYLSNNKDLKPDIIIKSMLEIIMFEDYLRNHSLESYSRVFKLNGRYRLNSKFDYSRHLKAENKVLILKPFMTDYIYSYTPPTLFLYETRCWSFDSNLKLNISNTYTKMKKDIISISKTKRQGDIEHLFYKHLDKRLVEYTNIMGVEGYWAPQNIWLEE